MEQRTWTHEETPLGVPSAAAYRTGCKCDACREANIAYMKAYHARLVALEDNEDGTTFYHAHKGAPSTTTAVKWGCIHPRCLNLGSLYLDAATGRVHRKADDSLEPAFGVPVAPAAAPAA